MQEFFSDGFTDELIAQVGRAAPDELRVIARASAMRYKHIDKSIETIGRELGVSHALEGGVRRAGERVRITARLIRTGDQAQLWAGTMPESGIGSQAALAAASLPLFVYPSDLEPSARWFGRNGDVIKLTMGKDGRMAVPRQSCGRLLDPARFRLLTAPLVLGRHDQAEH